MEYLKREEFLKKLESEREELYRCDKKLLDKKKTYTSCHEIEEKLEPSQFRIDMNGYRFECLFQRGKGENLYVIYDGARKDDFPVYYYRGEVTDNNVVFALSVEL